MLRSTQRKAVIALAALTLTSSFGVLANFASAADDLPTGVTITGLTVAKGSTAGGTSTIINGTGFNSFTDLGVKFGATAAPKVIVLSDTQVAAVSPAGAAGPPAVDVTLTDKKDAETPAVEYAAPTGSTKDDFTYITPYNATVPAGTLLNSLGGTKITVTSSVAWGASATEFGLNKVTATVGGVVAPLTWATDKTATLVAPAGTPTATAPKIVLLHDGVPGVAATGAKYAAVVGGIDKPVGPIAGGGDIIITGKGLKGASKWTFGTVEVASANCTPGGTTAPLDDTKVTCKVPAQADGFAGAVSVTFTPATGLTAGITSKATYTYSDLG